MTQDDFSRAHQWTEHAVGPGWAAVWEALTPPEREIAPDMSRTQFYGWTLEHHDRMEQATAMLVQLNVRQAEAAERAAVAAERQAVALERIARFGGGQ